MSFEFRHPLGVASTIGLKLPPFDRGREPAQGTGL
jgi:hypothetical protein